MQQEGTHLVSVSAWKEREVYLALLSRVSVRGGVKEDRAQWEHRAQVGTGSNG